MRNDRMRLLDILEAIENVRNVRLLSVAVGGKPSAKGLIGASQDPVISSRLNRVDSVWFSEETQHES
ncbi:MAG: hypothetical protein WBG50_18315 [Desulfomonilaceae bacterium]